MAKKLKVQKKETEELYRENNYQLANVLIVTGAIFLATLTIRQVWTNITQWSISLSVYQIILGVGIILLLRLQVFLQATKKTSDVAESLFFGLIATGLTSLVANFTLLIMALSGK